MCHLCNVEGREVGLVYVTTINNQEPRNFILADTTPRRFGDTVKWLCYCQCQSLAGKKARRTHQEAA